MPQPIDLYEEISNPLDAVEELFHTYEWRFCRNTMDRLTVQITGSYETYDISMIWDERRNSLQFLACYGFVIPEDNHALAAKTLMRLNENLWLGHFVLLPDCHVPALRYTSLFRGFFHSSGADQIEDLVDTAIKEMEQYYPVFEWISHTPVVQNSPLDLILMPARGES